MATITAPSCCGLVGHVRQCAWHPVVCLIPTPISVMSPNIICIQKQWNILKIKPLYLRSSRAQENLPKQEQGLNQRGSTHTAQQCSLLWLLEPRWRLGGAQTYTHGPAYQPILGLAYSATSKIRLWILRGERKVYLSWKLQRIPGTLRTITIGSL